MGFPITWFAIREERGQWLLDQLGLSPTSEREEFPESLVSTAKLATGWQILWYDRYDCPLLKPSDLEIVSREQEVLVCHIEEHVMASSAELWSGGARKWWHAHDGEEDPLGLTTDGDLPDCFSAINAEMQAAQRNEGGEKADVDYLFEIPLKAVGPKDPSLQCNRATSSLGCRDVGRREVDASSPPPGFDEDLGLVQLP